MSAESFASSGGEPYELIRSVQKDVAIHEAGHAVTRAIMFGVKEVDEVVVHTKCCADDLHDDLGHMAFAKRKFRFTLPLTRKLMVVYLGGRAADVVIGGAPTSGAGTDIHYANQYAWGIYTNTGLNGDLMTSTKSNASEVTRKQVRNEIEDANAYAEDIIKSNRATVLALAKLIMSQKVEDESRTVDSEEFKEFMKKRRLIDPRAQQE